MLKDFAFETGFFEQGYGLRFRGNIVNYIDRLVYFCGAHEKYMLCFLRDYVSNLKEKNIHPSSYVDVGANAGNHTLFMSKLVDRVYAFEPFERVRKQLEENLALNGIDNVTVYPFGLSDQEDVLPFYAAPDSNLGAASFYADHKQDNYYLGDMRLKVGDAVLKESGVERVGIIKADVEGFEKHVLLGLQETIRRSRPLMIIELSPKTRQTLSGEGEFLSLFPKGYRFFYFSGVNYDRGAYTLAPFDYAIETKIQDVIACPEETLAWLPQRG